MKPIIEEIRDGMAGHAAGLGERVRSNKWDRLEYIGVEPIEGESDEALGLRIIEAVRNGVVPSMDSSDIEFDAAYYAGMEGVLELLERRSDELLAAALRSDAVLDEAADTDYFLPPEKQTSDTDTPDSERIIRERALVMPEGYCDDSSEVTTAYAAMLGVLGFSKSNI